MKNTTEPKVNMVLIASSSKRKNQDLNDISVISELIAKQEMDAHIFFTSNLDAETFYSLGIDDFALAYKVINCMRKHSDVTIVVIDMKNLRD